MLFGWKVEQSDRLEQALESHIQHEMGAEGTIFLAVVASFRELDKVARELGFLSRTASYTRQVPWWPIIAVLGTYSAGKSTFLNDYLDHPLQLTGNQAVDDKFTVVCYGKEVRTLPALALDADPRFPFYKISQDLESSAPGEGGRMDAYLQLKTCPSEVARGRILIDSPGFDADEQRTAVLRLTDHIVALSDLVLVFFDARHPEAGSMRDTLDHLVEKTIRRSDSNKFLYVLNHLDATAQDDNAEQVVAAWQRSLAQKGLTAGRFYHIYSRSATTLIDNPQVRARYEALRAHDYAEIQTRIQQVRTAQAYRVVGALERSADELERYVIPQLRSMLRAWRTGIVWRDGLLLGVGIALTGLLVWLGLGEVVLGLGVWGLGGACLLAGYAHWQVRRRVGERIIAAFRQDQTDQSDRYVDNLAAAFQRNTCWYRSMFRTEPTAWNARTRTLVHKIRSEADRYVQQLNDIYTNPSGAAQPHPEPIGAPQPSPPPVQSGK